MNKQRLKDKHFSVSRPIKTRNPCNLNEYRDLSLYRASFLDHANPASFC